jgi:hypothetical protein
VVGSEQCSAASLSYTRLWGAVEHLQHSNSCSVYASGCTYAAQCVLVSRPQPDGEGSQVTQRHPHAAVQRRAQLLPWEGRPLIQGLQALATVVTMS